MQRTELENFTVGGENGGQVLGELPPGPEERPGALRQRVPHHTGPAGARAEAVCGEVGIHRTAQPGGHGPSQR